MINYQTTAIDSHFAGETNDCAVHAVAIATQTSYQNTLDTFTRLGRSKGKATPDWMIWRALRELGYKAVHPGNIAEVDDMTWKVKPVPPAPRKYYTFNTIYEILYQDHSYIIMSRNHASAVIGNRIEDWAASSKKRVVNVWRIVPINFKGE